ncbi:mechanosensitive ion channel domain-containing protein [Paraburkholderia domus]|uniref:mechanosensitive ion channel domain-containing protein n=1 Tax=Paraburkholderia domus TaxID=2793075 RepID=UPI001B0E3028|nr:mechanosensitive ion channel family protein [Paraburkholderia domus]CAE6826213.1 hypothetical protein R75483_06490 [Paraburkholderia domus]
MSSLAENPLILGGILLAAEFVTWRTVPSELRSAKLAMRVLIFAAFSAVLFGTGLSPLHVAPWPTDASRHLVAQILELAWWFLGARLATLVLDTFFLPESWQKERLFEDVLGAVVFLAAGVAAIAYVLELPVRGLLATSGAVAIVLGLAIQSTLSDVFSGIVLNATRPYHLGDTVSIDGVDGKVIEMSWRATQLLNSFGNVVTIPNTLAAKVKIVNLSRPDAIHGISVVLHVSPEARPAAVVGALQRAIKGCDLALAAPQPTVGVIATHPNSTSYEMTCYVADMSKTLVAKNQLFDLAFRHLAAAQIGLRPLSYPAQVPSGDDPREHLLACVDMFQTLNPVQLAELAGRSVRLDFEPGAILASEGDVTDYLLVVASGVLTVQAKDSHGNAREIDRLGPGDSLGETGVLTGGALHVIVTADTNVVVYKLEKNGLTALLKSNPEVARKMCLLVSRRGDPGQAMLGAESQPEGNEGLFQRIWDRMRKFHGLSN